MIMLTELTAILFKKAPAPLRKMQTKKPANKKRVLISRAVAAGSLGVLLLLLNLLKMSAGFSEFFTRYISQAFTFIGAGLTSWLSPFSLFELLAVCTGLYAAKTVARWLICLFKRRWYLLLKSLLAVAVAALVVFNYYTVCAGFSYSRKPVELPMSAAAYQDGDVKEIADYFYGDFTKLSKTLPRDENGNASAPYDLKGMAKALQKEYARLDQNPYFFRFTPRAKTIKNSWFLTSSQITGIAFLPTGEANVNYLPAAASLAAAAHTMAHELAHTKGVMRENDANLVGYYILLTSEDSFLRYAGYLYSISYMRRAVELSEPLNPEAGEEYRAAYPEEALRELKNVTQFWDEYTGPFDWLDRFLENAAEFFNNLYLKSNGVESGTESYNDFPSGNTDTGKTNPDTGETLLTPVYNNMQKMFFAIYENR